MNIVERFLKYISFNTQSNLSSDTIPSTYNQIEFANYLVEEMKSIGISNAHLDEYGIVYGTIKGNYGCNSKGIGYISHMDTSPDYSGENIKPNIIYNYSGNVIRLNDKMILDPKEFNILNTLVGHDLITSDGNTLLGGDDKAGIAIIMTMAQYYYDHQDIKHPTIEIAFTCDE